MPSVFSAQASSVLTPGANSILTETFQGATVQNPFWTVGTSRTGSSSPILTAGTGAAGPGGIPGGTTAIDQPGSGALRLTSNANNQGAFVLYNQAINASGGLTISFNLYSYGGTGADGISFFLIDGNANPTTAGATGGSLGYSSNTLPGEVGPGIVGGYIGIGFDEFGNFSAPPYGAGGTARTPQSVVIRGSEATNYRLLTGSQLPSGSQLDFPNQSVSRDLYRRFVQIDISPSAIVSVRIDLNNDGDFEDAGEKPIVNFDVSAPTANNAPLPSTFKFGFGASTGGATNIHEINAFQIDPFVPQVSFTSPGQTVLENAGRLTLTTQIDAASSTPVTIPVTLSGTASNGTDYSIPTTITIPANSLTGTIDLSIINDRVQEPDETVIVTLGTPTSGNARLGPTNTVFTATIVDDGDPASTPNSCDDFNGDGFADIIWRDYAPGNAGSNIIWLMNGTTPISAVSLVNVPGTNWVIEGTCDFNGDNNPDIVWRDYFSGRNVVWLMNGTISTTAVELVAVGDLNWQIGGVGDFNGDDNPDIYWRNYATGGNLVWLMNNTTSTVAVNLVTVGDLTWDLEDVGDLNGDGKADLIWRNYTTGENLTWLVDGITSIGSVALPRVAYGTNKWNIEKAGADFNGDGQADLIWRDYSDSSNLFWFLNQTTSTAGSSLLNVPGSNWQIEDFSRFV